MDVKGCRELVNESGMRHHGLDMPAAAAVSKSLLRGLASWMARWNQRRSLDRLEIHLLDDIGITRADVAREVAKPFWRG